MDGRKSTSKAWDQSWQSALDIYGELAQSNDGSLRMRQLISELKDVSGVRGLFAHTSVSALVISPYSKFPDWSEGRRLSVQALGDATVKIQLHQGLNEPDEWEIEFGSAPHLIQSLCDQHL